MNPFSGLGFAQISAAWLAALAVPVVVFYFLKLRRPRAEVPSLALWRRVVNDRRVNSPFQKFRRNLLLLLQLLLLAALMLAAMQPFLTAGAETAEYRVLLIDASASMAAEDAAGESRLDVAKRRAGELVDDLLPGQRLAVVAFDRSARPLTEFTGNPRLLNAALDRLEVRDVESDLGDALRVADALARTAPVAEAIILSDGNVPPAGDVDLAFPVNYQRLPPAGPNVGITALNARRSGVGGAETGGGWDLFVKLAASGPGGAVVELFEEGNSRPLASESVGFASAAEAPRLVFGVPAGDARRVRVKVTAEGEDSLRADDEVALPLPPPRPLTAYCPPGMAAFRRGLDLNADAISLYPRPGEANPALFDLVVTDAADAPDAPAPAGSVRLFAGVVPPDLAGLVEVNVGYAEVVDWRRTAPALQSVQLGDVQITEEPTFTGDAETADLEELGYETLIDARGGPLMLRRREGRRVDYFLLFDPDASTLPYRVAFPILLQNLVREATRAAELSEVRAVETGSLPPVGLSAPGTAATVRGPAGTETVRAGTDGVLAGVPAPLAGNYTISEGGEPVAAYSAGVLSPLETSLNGVESLTFREVEVAASEGGVKTDRPLWDWLALAALALLLAEWWVFHRRPAV